MYEYSLSTSSVVPYRIRSTIWSATCASTHSAGDRSALQLIKAKSAEGAHLLNNCINMLRHSRFVSQRLLALHPLYHLEINRSREIEKETQLYTYLEIQSKPHYLAPFQIEERIESFSIFSPLILSTERASTITSCNVQCGNNNRNDYLDMI